MCSIDGSLLHAAVKRELVAVERPAGWTPPSILRPPEVLTESEQVEAQKNKARRIAVNIAKLPEPIAQVNISNDAKPSKPRPPR